MPIELAFSAPRWRANWNKTSNMHVIEIAV
jgi:hypothetical protein